MERGNTKKVRIIVISVLITILAVVCTALIIKSKSKELISFDANDKAYFRALTETLDNPKDLKFKSLDAYYQNKIYYYNAVYSFYLDVDNKWYDVEEVCYGREGKVTASYYLTWDSIEGYEDVNKNFENAKKAGVHNTYTAEKIQSLLDAAYKGEFTN